MSRFDSYTDSYEAAVEQSIGFSRQKVSYFARRKAMHLLDVCGRYVGDPEKLSVLDVGCGIGITDEHLVGHVRELHGVDTSAETLERAAARNPEARYRACSEHSLPFDSGTFDAAFAACVLHHVDPDKRLAFVSELRRVLRPGGVAVLFEHNPLNPLTRIAVSRCEFDDDAILLGRRAASGLLEKSGLCPIERRYIVFFSGGDARVRAIERFLGAVPLGAQYYVVGARRSEID
jgi:SAM-dependent methyltransferase